MLDTTSICRLTGTFFVALLLNACNFLDEDGGGGPTRPSPVTPGTTSPPSSGGPTSDLQELPPEPSRSSGPQAGGTDITGVEVAGRGTTRFMSIANDSSRNVTYSAGDWLEPKDGSYQRMMILQTVVANPGRVVDVRTACMQKRKRVPAEGTRYFSRPKTASGTLQQCQEACLGSGQEQDCIWECELPKVVWTIEDGCNDGEPIEYRFFIIRDRQIVAIWPSRSEVYVASTFGSEYTTTVSPGRGGQVCYGASTGNTYWGIGIDGDESCSGCCYNIPTGGRIDVSRTLTCN